MTWAEWLLQVEKIVGAWRGQQLLASTRGEPGELYWTAWSDPGKATGFGAAVYLTVPAPELAAGGVVSRLGVMADRWMKLLGGLGVQQTPEDLLATFDATGALVLTYWAEDFYARSVEEEPAMVRKIVGRIRQLGAMWGGDEDETTWGLGAAGIGVEVFRVLKLDSSEDYVSPLRVIAMIRYAVEDEFGIQIKSNSPGDAKGEFGVFQWKRLGMWVAGPDHVRDALSHVMLGIRKSFRK